MSGKGEKSPIENEPFNPLPAPNIPLSWYKVNQMRLSLSSFIEAETRYRALLGLDQRSIAYSYPGMFKLQKPDRLIICIYLQLKSYTYNREYNLLSNRNH